MKGYRKTESWVKNTNTFTLEIKRFSHFGSDENIWNIYANLFPMHPLFDKCTEQHYGSDIEFHGGCTYFRWIRNAKGEVTCKTYGCDYNHYEDDEFISQTTLTADSEILKDAEEIFKFLSREDEE